MAETSDNELVQRVVRQDEQAFLLLYDRFASRVYTLVLYIVGEAQLAEEITQDIFLKFWNRANSFRPERGAFGSWLLALARNTALDHLRFEKRRPRSSDGVDPEELWELLPQEDSKSEEARWRTLYFALKSLPEDQRMVIEMAYYQGMSHSEIAVQLGWPIGTVKTRMRLGMDVLRRQWLEEENSHK